MDYRISSGRGGAGQGAATGYMLGGPVGGVIGGVAGGIAGVLGGGGEDDAEQLMEDQIKALRAGAVEQKRRSLREMNQTLGTARAAAYSGNIQNTGTTKLYQDALAGEMRHRIAWDDQRVRMEEEVLRQGGRMAGSAIQAQGFGQLLKGATALGTAGASAGWFSPQMTNAQVDSALGAEQWSFT